MESVFHISCHTRQHVSKPTGCMKLCKRTKVNKEREKENVLIKQVNRLLQGFRIEKGI